MSHLDEAKLKLIEELKEDLQKELVQKRELRKQREKESKR